MNVRHRRRGVVVTSFIYEFKRVCIWRPLPQEPLWFLLNVCIKLNLYLTAHFVSTSPLKVIGYACYLHAFQHCYLFIYTTYTIHTTSWRLYIYAICICCFTPLCILKQGKRYIILDILHFRRFIQYIVFIWYCYVLQSVYINIYGHYYYPEWIRAIFINARNISDPLFSHIRSPIDRPEAVHNKS